MKEIFFWKKAPFFRLLIAFISGIIMQWYWPIAPVVWYTILAVTLLAATSFFYLPLFRRYRFGFINGAIILLPFTVVGALLVSQHDIRRVENWIGHYTTENRTYVVTLEEPPVEKNKSFKSNASINCIVKNGQSVFVKGKIVLYVKKDSLLPRLAYGSQIVFKKKLQEIKNAGNPGGFDYKRYSLFHGITHQVYLQSGEFIVLQQTNKNWLQSFLETNREKVLTILRRNIEGTKELGLAEALLIGYKDDLDKTLIQSYTNTGVVHIIAISGLHLGLIYGLLLLLLKPLQQHRYIKWLRPVIILCGLWIFTLLAGAQPSILRSAVMFTCIVAGENLTKKTSVFNNLALSAFLLLCYNPFWLWDVGFQLSYSAVLSIVIFMRPIYNLFYIKNKLLDLFWKLNAVTIAAQVLTLPVSVYYFHQFPVHFLLTNFVAVPLSSIILLGEIVLCIISFTPGVATFIGKIISWLIGIMNSYIEKIESLPFSLWDGLQINIPQAALLFLFIAGMSCWWLEKTKTGLKAGIIALLSFFILRSYSFIEKNRQRKIIVYNVPRHQAVDFIYSRHLFFAGDPELQENDFARNFHLKPSRVLQRVGSPEAIASLTRDKNYISFGNRKIVLLDNTISYTTMPERQPIDLLIISKNPKLYISQLNQSFRIKQIVFDASVPARKLNYWKKDCDSLHIPYHDVAEKGAFVMTLN